MYILFFINDLTKWQWGWGEEARWFLWIAPLLGPLPTPSSWGEEENLRKLRNLLCIEARSDNHLVCEMLRLLRQDMTKVEIHEWCIEQ